MAITRVAGRLVRALVAGVFGAAGTVVGAAYGLLSAGFVDEEDGFMHGTLLGAVAGALVSLDLARSLLAISCRRHQDDHCSTGTGRIKRTVGAVVGLTALADPHYSGRGDRLLVFAPDGQVITKTKDAVVATTKDTAGQTTCPICLQGYRRGGERAGRLRACSHVFHVGCIRRWLLRRPHCPMCRHAVRWLLRRPHCPMCRHAVS